MDYNTDTLQQVKEAIKDYMLHRFPSKTSADIIPSFKTIANSKQVLTATLPLGDGEKEHYIRKGIHDLLDEGFLLIQKRGEIHVFQGKGKALEAMFSKIEEEELTSLEEVDYTHLPSHLGFATPVDNSLIWEGYDPYDK